MNTILKLTPTELKECVIEFYSKYNYDIENLKTKIVNQLQKLTSTYITENKLPEGSLNISARTKTLKSTLDKLEHKGYPQFSYLPEVITDLLGIRVICWFLDDCYGIEKYIKQSEIFIITNTENYIDSPKKSGYRAIHLNASIYNEGCKNNFNLFKLPLILPFHFEIQIKTKLQETWGDISHEFYLASKKTNIKNKKYESFLEKSSLRLNNEDKVLNNFKIIWQTLKNDNSHGYL